MKPRADQGVVDARLNVYGVTNLKVADLSIVPKNVGTVGTGRGSFDLQSNRLSRTHIRQRFSLEKRLR
jgi:hypothetical protein